METCDGIIGTHIHIAGPGALSSSDAYNSAIRWWPDISSLAGSSISTQDNGHILNNNLASDIQSLLPAGHNLHGFGGAQTYSQWTYTDIARYGNKVWQVVRTSSGPFRYNVIVEYIFDINALTLTANRIIDLPSPYQHYSVGGTSNLFTTGGGCGINDNTLRLVGWGISGSLPYGANSCGIYEIDVSSSTAVVTPLFQLQHGFGRDVQYIASSDTYVYTFGPPATADEYLFHVDSSGNILGQVLLPSGNGYAICCYNGDVWVDQLSMSAGSTVSKVDLTTYTLDATASVNGFLMLGDFATNPECCGIEDDDDDDFEPALLPCYKIGDITDPAHGMGGAGGMVFATPNSGWNNTPFYYEVALEDLHTGGTPYQNHRDHNPNLGGTMSSGDGESDCGIPAIGEAAFTLGFSPSLDSVNAQLPNNQARYGYGPSSPIDPLNTTPNPTWGGSIYPLPQHFPANVPVVGLDQNQHLIFPAGTTLTTVDIVPMGASVSNSGQAVATLPYETYLFTFSQSMALGINQIVKTITFGGIIPAQPFTPTGAEWGDYGGAYANPVSIWWDTGQSNTSGIVTHPAQPVFPSHEIAARVASSYNPPGTGVDRWFLPSLMEFDEMFRNVGLDPVHAVALNLSTPTTPDMMDYTYWTSSDVTGLAPGSVGLAGPNWVGANDPSNHYAWAYVTGDSPLGGTPPIALGPTMAKRCSSFSVRPIRRFECLEAVDPDDVPDYPLTDETYNFRDATVTWTNSFAQNQNQSYFKGPYLGLWVPGAAGSYNTWYWNDPDQPGVCSPNAPGASDLETYIGRHRFRIRLADTDAMGNGWDTHAFHDATNPNGHTISIWNNKKEFLGTWHYQTCLYHSKVTHLNPRAVYGGPGVGVEPWDNSPNPDLCHKYFELDFRDVTHIAGPYKEVIYGDNQALSSAFRSFNPQVHHDWYEHKYMDYGFNSHSGSYAYIKIENGHTATFQNPYADVQNGNNTAIDDINIICAREPLESSLNHYLSLGNTQQSAANATQSNSDWYGMRMAHSAGFIGCGGTWQWDEPLVPTPVPSTYAYTYSFGTNTLGLQDCSPPGLPSFPSHYADWDWKDYGKTNGPFHFLFEWVADYQPTSSGLTWYPDFDTAWNDRENCGEGRPLPIDCEYNVGDIGPAGGIIVAVPYMNINDPGNGVVGPVVSPLQGSEFIENPTAYYFELSPDNLNYQDCSGSNNIQHTWGSFDNMGTIVDLNTNVSYQNYFVPEILSYSGYTFTPGYENEIPGEGLGNTLDLHSVNSGNPNNTVLANDNCCGAANQPIIYENAFNACVSYILNGYDDWFLPTTLEMQFARNYTAPGTLYDSTNINTAGCGSPYIDTPYYWTSNVLKQDDSDANLLINNVSLDNSIGFSSVFNQWGGTVPGSPWWTVNKDSTAFIVSMNPITSTSGPEGLNWRTLQYRGRAANVRAMRRFLCDDPIAPPPCAVTTDTYVQGVNENDCSCVEYNYRDGLWAGYPDPLTGTVYWGTPPGHTLFSGTDSPDPTTALSDNYIGGGLLNIRLSQRDVKGNLWSFNELNNNGTVGTTYTITIWDMYYSLVGKWKYDTLVASSSYAQGLKTYTGQNTWNDMATLWLGSPTHLDGPNPIVDIANIPNGVHSGGSNTHCYVKVESVFNSLTPSAQSFEIACNATIWNNLEFPTWNDWNLMPAVCDPTSTVLVDCVPTWGTDTHYDMSLSNVLFVFPDYTACDNGCGGASIAGSSTAKLQSAADLTYYTSTIGVPGESIEPEVLKEKIKELEVLLVKEEEKQELQELVEIVKQEEQVEPKIIPTPPTLPTPPTPPTTDYTGSGGSDSGSSGGGGGGY